jgi:hypothetical protein
VKSFKDREGRAWDLVLNLGSLKRIKAATGLDMLDLNVASKQRSDVFERLSTDPVTLADALCAVCRPQLDTRNISDDAFAEALGGEAIDDALVALVGEWADFFRQRRNEVAATFLDQALVMIAEVRERMNQTAPQLREALSADRLFSKSPTNSPGSSESTPTPSLSAN